MRVEEIVKCTAEGCERMYFNLDAQIDVTQVELVERSHSADTALAQSLARELRTSCALSACRLTALCIQTTSWRVLVPHPLPNSTFIPRCTYSLKPDN